MPLMFGNSLAKKRFSPSNFENASLSYADFAHHLRIRVVV